MKASFPRKENKFINTYINFTINNFRGSQTLILSLSSVVEPLNFGWIHSEFKATFPTSLAPGVAMWLGPAQSFGSGSHMSFVGHFSPFSLFPGWKADVMMNHPRRQGKKQIPRDSGPWVVSIVFAPLLPVSSSLIPIVFYWTQLSKLQF